MTSKKREPRKHPRKRGRPKKAESEKIKYMPAAERRPQVMKLRLQGYGPDEIACKLQIRPATVRADLKRMAAESAQETPNKVRRRHEQDQRLEMLWKALQPAVDGTHIEGIKTALKVLERQAKLNGLDVDPKATVTLIAPAQGDWDTILAQENPRAALGFEGTADIEQANDAD